MDMPDNRLGIPVVQVPPPTYLFSGFRDYFVRCIELVVDNLGLITAASCALTLPIFVGEIWLNKVLLERFGEEGLPMVFDAKLIIQAAILQMGWLIYSLTPIVVLSSIVAARLAVNPVPVREGLLWSMKRFPAADSGAR